jgi:ATP-dependent Clp protease ATP-binding subunit ClpX
MAAIGYKSTQEGVDIDSENLLQYIIPKDLKDFGLIPEIIGRLPVLTHMNPLDKGTLRAILTEPKNALIKQYKKLFEMDNISLEFKDEALDFIVQKAVEYKLGARGLRSLCEEILTDAMFSLPGSQQESLIVDKSYAKKHLDRSSLKKLKAVS